MGIMLSQEPDSSGIRGSIVFVTSVLAEHPAPGYFATHAYAGDQRGRELVYQSPGRLLRPRGDPGQCHRLGTRQDPDGRASRGDPKISAYASRKQPLAGGLLEAEDIAAAGAYLLGDSSRRVTGQVLAVDGGWSVTESSP